MSMLVRPIPPHPPSAPPKPPPPPSPLPPPDGGFELPPGLGLIQDGGGALRSGGSGSLGGWCPVAIQDQIFKAVNHVDELMANGWRRSKFWERKTPVAVSPIPIGAAAS